MNPEELRSTLWKVFRNNYNFWVTTSDGYLHRYKKVFIADQKLVILDKNSNYDSVSYTGIESKLFKYQTNNILA